MSLPPTLDHLGQENSASSGGRLAGFAGRPMKRRRHLVADRAVRSNLIVVSTPSLAFSLGLVEAKEPVQVEALVAQRTIEGLDLHVVGRLAWPGEVQTSLVVIGPEIYQVARELCAIAHWEQAR